MLSSAISFVVALSTSAASLLPYSDADNFNQAVAMIAVEIRVVDESRLYCAHEVEKGKRAFDHYALYWQTQNEDEILAVETHLGRRSDRDRFESLRDAAVSAAMVAFRAAAAVAGSEKLCSATFQSIQTGDRNVANRTPKASQFLKTYLRENPPAQEAAHFRNDVMGCEIQLSNKGAADLDSIRTTCRCVANVMRERASPDELAEIDRVARAHGDVVHLPAMTRLAPELASCASGMPSPTPPP
jgi:hypothetical protein